MYLQSRAGYWAHQALTGALEVTSAETYLMNIHFLLAIGLPCLWACGHVDAKGRSPSHGPPLKAFQAFWVAALFQLTSLFSRRELFVVAFTGSLGRVVSSSSLPPVSVDSVESTFGGTVACRQICCGGTNSQKTRRLTYFESLACNLGLSHYLL